MLNIVFFIEKHVTLKSKLFWNFVDKDDSKDKKLIKSMIVWFVYSTVIKEAISTTTWSSELRTLQRKLYCSSSDLIMLTPSTWLFPATSKASISIKSLKISSSRSRALKMNDWVKFLAKYSLHHPWLDLKWKQIDLYLG